MDRLLKQVLEHSKQDQCVQVDEGDLQWTPEHMMNNVLPQPLPKISNEDLKDNSPDNGAQGIQTNKQPRVETEGEGEGDEPLDEKDENQTYKDKYKYKVPTADITKSEEVKELKVEEEKINESLGIMGANNIVGGKQKSNRVVDIAALKQMALELTEQWNIPSFIIAFISNSLDSEEKGRVVPWAFFKKQLYEIYNERILYTPEINGSVNSNYLSLEEFLILFFMKKHKLRRLAEVKLIEFISSLKYYTKIWPRAKVFAKLTGMLQYSEPIDTDASSHSWDIFMQEFYYFAYSCFNIQNSKRPAEVNSTDYTENDGITYIKCEVEEELTPKILFWLGENDIKKWYHKMRRHVKRLPEESQSTNGEWLSYWIYYNADSRCIWGK